MKAYTRSIFDLFDGKRRYIVPLFQRQYVWTQEKQWEPLWDDITRMAEKRLEAPNRPAHFLGAMVLDQVRTYGDEVFAHLIIDGQQRLTTFQILLATFRDVAIKMGVPVYAEEVQRYLINTGIMKKPEEERFKLWPTRVDQESLKIIIEGPAGEEIESGKLPLESNLCKAYQFFHTAIHGYVTEPESERRRRVETIYHVLRKDLEIVSIELDSDDDPQVIFETLNARGEPLLPSDLLRNFLFWRASRNGEEKDILYEKYWLSFDQKFWKHEERLGRLKRPRIDIFLQHFLQSQGGQEINIGRLFHEYKTWITEGNPYETVESELKCLTAYSEIFRQVIEANPDMLPYGLFFWRLKQMDVGTIYPLLLYILTHPERDKQDVKAMFRDLESYLFRRQICGLTAKNYNNIFLQLIRDLKRSGFSRDNLRTALLNMGGEASIWPDDRRFSQAWLTRRVYGEIKPIQRVVVILKAIEDALHEMKSEVISIHSTLSIEHIMPQGWEKKWALSDGTYAKDWFTRITEGIRNPEADERDSLLHTFGNLTLVTGPLNSPLSNAPWKEKLPELSKHSGLALNRHLQDYSIWDSQSIRSRGQFMLEIALKLWPHS